MTLTAPPPASIQPAMTWEFSLGLYLVIEGFRPSPLTVGPNTACMYLSVYDRR